MELSKNFTLAELCKSQTATRHNIINIPTDQNIINNLIWTNLTEFIITNNLRI